MKDHELIIFTGRSKVTELERGMINSSKISILKVDGDSIPPTMALKIEDHIFIHTIELIYSKSNHRQSVTITEITRKVNERPGPTGFIEKHWTTYREEKHYRVRDGVNLFEEDAWNKLREHYKPAIMNSSWHTADIVQSSSGQLK